MNDSRVSLWSTDDLTHSEYSRALHRTFAFEPHFHSTTCLALIVDGALRLTIGRQLKTVGKGSFILINAGDVHAGHANSTDGWAMRTLHVAPGDLAIQMRSCGIEVAGEIPIKSGVYNTAPLADLFFGVHTCAQTNDDRLKRDESLQRLIALLAAHAEPNRPAARSKPTGDSCAATQIRDYIEDHLFDPIRLEDLSRVVSMPSYTVVRTFKRYYGLPPHRYHTQRRVDIARKLIREKVPLASLSHLCGFADQAHFTRTFRKTLGYTPGFYAQRAI